MRKIIHYLKNGKGQADLFSILVDQDSRGILYNVPKAKCDKWEINSLGFRGREIDLEKKEGHIRIACLGVSETFGYYEAKDKEWPCQLGEMLREKFPRVEVVNASVIGQNLKKNKDYVEKYVLPLKPDIMIIMQTFLIYTTDLMRGTVGRPLRDKRKDKKANGSIEGEPCGRIPERVLPNLGEILERCLPEWLLSRVQLWRIRQKMRKKEKRHLLGKKAMDEVPENILLEFERDLSSFVHYLKENHILPVLSTYPCLITPFNKDIYKDLLLATRVVFSIELSENGVLDASKKSNNVIKKMAEDQNVVFVDNDHLIPKTLEYFGDNFHFTDKGAELIAKNASTVLTHYGLVK
jgi:lysophospholipase L1-like esterase